MQKRVPLKLKLLLGFGLVLLFFFTNVIIIFFNIAHLRKVVVLAEKEKDETVQVFTDFKDLVLRSNMLTYYWVSQPNEDNPEKQKLLNLHEYEYPELVGEINKQIASMPEGSLQDSIKQQLLLMDSIVEYQRDVTRYLDIADVYTDPLVMFDANIILENAINPRSTKLIDQIEHVVGIQSDEKEALSADVIASLRQIQNTIILSLALIILFSIAFILFITKRIAEPVKKISEMLQTLSSGKQTERIKLSTSDEIGQMAEAANKLADNLSDTAAFAKAIGEGEYNASFTPASAEDVLGNSLVKMRESLTEVTAQESLRNWMNEGLSEFGNILRRSTENLDDFNYTVLSELVSYVSANQGMLFVVENIEVDEPYMRLSAAYAWNKRKYLEEKIYPKIGLSGEVWAEKQALLITEVPANFIKITSGLGETLPTNVYIVPLQFNDEVHGLIEIASLNPFKEHEIEFIDRVAEMLGAGLYSTENTYRMRKLLKESHEKTEQLHMQEEEMRQNIEELSATQEELERKIKQYEAAKKVEGKVYV
jgi:methyl-accepting chemotaxis protein